MARSAMTKRGSYGAAAGGNSGLSLGRENFFRMGDWRAVCDQCGMVCHASQMFLRWDNARTCWHCIEIRNPQDFLKGIADNQSPPWTRPMPPPIFVSGVAPTATQVVGGANTMINGYMINGVMIG